MIWEGLNRVCGKLETANWKHNEIQEINVPHKFRQGFYDKPQGGKLNRKDAVIKEAESSQISRDKDIPEVIH